MSGSKETNKIIRIKENNLINYKAYISILCLDAKILQYTSRPTFMK